MTRPIRNITPLDYDNRYIREPLIDRMANALGSDRFFFFFVGVSFGLGLAAVFVAAWVMP